MEHVSSLGATIVANLALAYAGGVLARFARLPLIVGYLSAGIVLGLFTPGFVADQKVVEQLAEIGVALLLFGVGLHFSIRDLVAVWKIAAPGAPIQVASSAVLGYQLAFAIASQGRGLVHVESAESRPRDICRADKVWRAHRTLPLHLWEANIAERLPLY